MGGKHGKKSPGGTPVKDLPLDPKKNGSIKKGSPKPGHPEKYRKEQLGENPGHPGRKQTEGGGDGLPVS